MPRKSNYDKFPFVEVPQGAGACARGWDAIAARLSETIRARNASKTVLVVECYAGVDEALVLSELSRALKPATTIHAREAMRSPAEIEQLVAPFLGGDDPVFGFLCGLKLPQFFDDGKLGRLREGA